MKFDLFFRFRVGLLTDDHVIALMESLGVSGLGVYIVLLWELRLHAHYRCSFASLAALARRWDVSVEELHQVIGNFRLFRIYQDEENGQMFSSIYLDEEMLMLDSNRVSTVPVRIEPDVTVMPVEEPTVKATVPLTVKRAADGRFTVATVPLIKKNKKNKEIIVVEEAATAVLPVDKPICLTPDPVASPDSSLAASSDSGLVASPDSSLAASSDSGLAASPGPSLVASSDSGLAASPGSSLAARSDFGLTPRSDSGFAPRPGSALSPRWERYIDAAFGEQSWLEVQAMHSGMGLRFMEELPAIIAFFKRHVVTYGKERSILSLEDAKSYFSNFVRQGSPAHKTLLAQLDRQHSLSRENDLYRHEQRDPVTGVRMYCGLILPPNAPPRPNAYAIWNECQWRWE